MGYDRMGYASYVSDGYLERMEAPTRPSCHRAQSVDTARVLLLVLTVALIVFAIGGALTAFDMAAQAAGSADADVTAFDSVAFDDASPDSNASTPVSQWQRGTAPYLYQRDPAWSEVPYAGESIGTSGCGPTCLSMVYVALTGKTDLSPAKMCAFSENGGYVEDGMTRWALLDEGASQLGLSSRIVAATPGTVATELAQGSPLILSMEPGDFTSVGHFIVACGLTSDGQLVVRDPNSPQRSHTAWDIDQVLSQARSVWSFSLA